MPQKVVVESFGPPDRLVLRTTEDLRPARGEVLIAVAYAGVASSDLLMRAGTYPGGPKPPYTPGWDVSGTVAAVGEGCDPRLLGRAVTALTLQGGYATQVVVPVERVVGVPNGADLRSVACVTLNYLVAWQMLRRVARVVTGEAVLVQGAAGGVGSALIDLARGLDLKVYGVGSPEKADVIRRYGASHLADQAEVQAVAARIGGFRVILDPVGGAATWHAWRSLAPGGRLVCFGFTGLSTRGSVTPRLALHLLLMKLRSTLTLSRRATFFRMSTSARRAPEALRRDLSALLDPLVAGHIDPLVGGVLPLGQAADAHRWLESRTSTGKLLLRVRP